MFAATSAWTICLNRAVPEGTQSRHVVMHIKKVWCEWLSTGLPLIYSSFLYVLVGFMEGMSNKSDFLPLKRVKFESILHASTTNFKFKKYIPRLCSSFSWLAGVWYLFLVLCVPCFPVKLFPLLFLSHLWLVCVLTPCVKAVFPLPSVPLCLVICVNVLYSGSSCS